MERLTQLPTFHHRCRAWGIHPSCVSPINLICHIIAPPMSDRYPTALDVDDAGDRTLPRRPSGCYH